MGRSDARDAVYIGRRLKRLVPDLQDSLDTIFVGSVSIQRVADEITLSILGKLPQDVAEKHGFKKPLLSATWRSQFGLDVDAVVRALHDIDGERARAIVLRFRDGRRDECPISWDPSRLYPRDVTDELQSLMMSEQYSLILAFAKRHFAEFLRYLRVEPVLDPAEFAPRFEQMIPDVRKLERALHYAKPNAEAFSLALFAAFNHIMDEEVENSLSQLPARASQRAILAAFVQRFGEASEAFLPSLSAWGGRCGKPLPRDLLAAVAETRQSLETEAYEKSLRLPATDVDIDALSGVGFELFLRDLYTKAGYEVQSTKASHDQGADLIVLKHGRRTVVQAKRHAGAVGNSAVQEAVAAVAYYGAQGATVIVSSYFTSSAIQLAARNDVLLIDGAKLRAIVQGAPL